jgi:hypothetical protein
VSDNLNKTDSRATALAEVKAKRVVYDPRIGEYAVKGEEDTEETARGARRRTYSELRTAGLVTTGSLSQPSLVSLTPLGNDVAEEWEID